MLVICRKFCYNVFNFSTKGVATVTIDGKKIKRYQNFKKLNDYYFQAIKSIARESLSELTFVSIKSHNISKSTDSIYFEFEISHHSEIFTISLRTHQPREVAENYFYFYLYDYKNLIELKKAIQRQLIDYYNKNETKDLSQYIKKPYSLNKATLKKYKRNQTKPRQCRHQSFNQLMKKINQKNKSVI